VACELSKLSYAGRAEYKYKYKLYKLLNIFLYIFLLRLIVGWPSTTPSLVVRASKCLAQASVPPRMPQTPKNTPKKVSFGIDFRIISCK
jgi:hypothetical protein